MLEIRHISKKYKTGSFIQTALDDVSLNFRDNEFVSILGPSGSGKTTLLNIIGGLDQYDSGDIVINNISTKDYKDKDWDSYRSHSIGFIFQSYNLIPHQSVLSNVELALTISNAPSEKRRELAIEALEKVGLKDHIYKKPNQLSGGQMQRVAIARALVNNPSIILADEPTGALDSKTSVQVMELLKEVAKDRLVIMVTHNPELAHQYSNRIVELRDGVLCSDSNPFRIKKKDKKANQTESFGKVGMSLLTSMKLSFNNLISKHKRTALVAIAGSIGIIGIAMIMSVSNGANAYIHDMEQQTLSEYPLQINKSQFDLTSMMTLREHDEEQDKRDKVYERQIISSMFGTVRENDLGSLKTYLDNNQELLNYVKEIEYGYDVTPYLYQINDQGTARQVSPDTVISGMGLSSFASLFTGNNTTFSMLPVNDSLYKDQYEILKGKWPENTNELVVVLNSDNTLPDLALYNIGLKDPTLLDDMISKYSGGNREDKIDLGKSGTWDYEEVLTKELKLVDSSVLYSFDEKLGCWIKETEQDVINEIANNGMTLNIVGIVRPIKGSSTPILTPGICYTYSLIEHVVNTAKESEIVKQQLANQRIDVFTGKEFNNKDDTFDMSKLFDFDEDAFNRIFEFDGESVHFDTSAFDSINIGSFNLTDYINASNLSSQMGSLTINAITQLFQDVKVDITTEKLSALFNDLYKDFLVYENNDYSMDIGNLGESIKTYLQTEEAADIIKESLKTQIDNATDTLKTSEQFVNALAVFLNNYLDYLKANEIESPSNESVQAFLLTESAKNSMANIEKAVDDVLQTFITQKETIDTLLKDLNDGYESYAKVHNMPIVSEIASAFIEYLKTEQGNEILSAHAEKMIDMNKLRSNLSAVATNVGNTIMSSLSGSLSSAMKAVGTQLGIQIENAVTTAMTDYMSNLASNFEFNTDSLLDVVDISMSGEKVKELMTNMFSEKQTNAKSNLKALCYTDFDQPETITFYPIDFEAKNNVVQMLNDYNDEMRQQGQDDKMIIFTDMVGSLMTSVTDIVDIIQYVLIAFVSISLVVSSIMIGVITYISVLERKKEIGILRAMGASKHNITQVFNSETIITGFLAGLIGVITTWIILIPTNKILQHITGAQNLHGYLPIISAIELILLSIILTTIGGLIPSRSAAKQDPVLALRSE